MPNALSLKVRLLGVALALGAAALPSMVNAATLIVNADGQLASATGVMVSGQSYNVEFVDGSCVSLFGGCNSALDFTFRTETDARAATQALIDQVFLDGPLGNFDQVPQLTFGCATIRELIPSCQTIVPYAVASDVVLAVTAHNRLFTASDFISPTGPGLTRTLDLSGDEGAAFPSVYARFSPGQVTAVPEPASWAMMILGFGAIGSTIRRRRGPVSLRFA